jgi:hypothetical protein
LASKILIGIALDGDSEVKRKLQEVGEAGKRSLENIGKNLARSGGGGKNALPNCRSPRSRCEQRWRRYHKRVAWAVCSGADCWVGYSASSPAPPESSAASVRL